MPPWHTSILVLLIGGTLSFGQTPVPLAPPCSGSNGPPCVMFDSPDKVPYMIWPNDARTPRQSTWTPPPGPTYQAHPPLSPREDPLNNNNVIPPIVIPPPDESKVIDSPQVKLVGPIQPLPTQQWNQQNQQAYQAWQKIGDTVGDAIGQAIFNHRMAKQRAEQAAAMAEQIEKTNAAIGWSSKMNCFMDPNNHAFCLGKVPDCPIPDPPAGASSAEVLKFLQEPHPCSTEQLMEIAEAKKQDEAETKANRETWKKNHPYAICWVNNDGSKSRVGNYESNLAAVISAERANKRADEKYGTHLAYSIETTTTCPTAPASVVAADISERDSNVLAALQDDAACKGLHVIADPFEGSDPPDVKFIASEPYVVDPNNALKALPIDSESKHLVANLWYGVGNNTVTFMHGSDIRELAHNICSLVVSNSRDQSASAMVPPPPPNGEQIILQTPPPPPPNGEQVIPQTNDAPPPSR